jgi:recombination protein RecA
MDDNRKKALAAALGQIEKQFGKGSVMRMGDGNAIRNVEAVSTGSLGLDIALGVGGVPKGRVVEIYLCRIAEVFVCLMGGKNRAMQA